MDSQDLEITLTGESMQIQRESRDRELAEMRHKMFLILKEALFTENELNSMGLSYKELENKS
jgi:hypothetical protein